MRSQVSTSSRRMIRSLRSALILCAATLVAVGCSKDHDLDKVTNPADPNQTGLTPPVPIGVQGTLFSRTVELNWRLSDSTKDALRYGGIAAGIAGLLLGVAGLARRRQAVAA